MSDSAGVGAPGFAANIRPKFRDGDIACMAPRGIELGDAVWMRDPAGDPAYPDHAHARQVLDALQSGAMPPDQPWPGDWLATFKSWMDQGFQP